MFEIWIVRIGGAFLILLCGSLSFWIVRDLIGSKDLQYWITSLGIFIGIGLALWQQRAIQGRETEQRHRKSIAARSVLPAALAEIGEYTAKCANMVSSHYPTTNLLTVVLPTQVRPDFPNDAIAILRDCIEHGERADSDRMAKCIRKLQVVSSRLRDFLNKSIQPTIGVSRHSFDSMLSDFVELKSITNSLFGYARMSGESPDRDLTISSMWELNLNEDNLPTFYEYMRRVGKIH